jgi:hypothetical protein
MSLWRDARYEEIAVGAGLGAYIRVRMFFSLDFIPAEWKDKAEAEGKLVFYTTANALIGTLSFIKRFSASSEALGLPKVKHTR